MTPSDEARAIFTALEGQICCRTSVGRGRSLSLGFGNLRSSKRVNGTEALYGEWEIGTYSAAWRVIRHDKIICGSSDLVERISDLDSTLREVEFGRFASIVVGELDVSLKFDNSLVVDFMSASAGEDEIVHVFAPDHVYAEYLPWIGWKAGRSDVPWK